VVDPSKKVPGPQLWGTKSVIRGTGSQIKGAGSEIRRDPPPPNLTPAVARTSLMCFQECARAAV